MPILVLSNAAHTSIRRSLIRDTGNWTNGWSRRVPGTTWWEVELSLQTINDLRSYQRPGEDLSTAIIRMMALHDQRRTHTNA